MRVALKIAAIVMCVLMVVWSSLEWVHVNRETAIVEQELRRDHDILGSALVAALDAREESISDRELRELLDAVELAEGAIALSWEPTAEPLGSQVLGSTTLSSRFPLEVGGTPGVLVLQEPLDEVARVAGNGRRSLLLRSLMMMALGLLVAASGGQVLVGTRLEQLVQRTRSIAEGDVKPRPAVGGGDEIGWVGQAIESLAADLARSRFEVQQEHDARLQAVQQLRHADRLRLVGDLAAGVAHELGSPLHVVAGSARLLAEDPSLSEEGREEAREIRTQVERMSGLVQRLLELSHPEPGQAGPTPLSTLWSDLQGTASGLVRDTAVKLEWSDAPDVRIAFRSAWFVQVLANLIRNAVQAQPDGGRVALSVEARGNRACIHVDDAGPGIPTDQRERVFAPFVTSKEPGAGLGLGLSLVQGLVEEAGGEVTITDGPLGGARVTVGFPIASEEGA